MADEGRIQFMFITNDGEMAAYVVTHGVDRIFVDLEIIGKKERQGHLDTVMSAHTIADVGRVRQVLPASEMLVRLNPLHSGSASEIEQVMFHRPDWIMLPMFRTLHEVRQVCAMVGGRAKLVLLVETPEAVSILPELVLITGIHEIFVGLNDLHLALGMDFLFEPLANGTLDEISAITRKAGLRFGFGGIARPNEGELASEAILGEHLRLHSTSVILSRSFHARSTTLSEMQSRLDFPGEIEKLRSIEKRLHRRSSTEVLENKAFVANKVKEIVRRKRLARDRTHETLI